MKITGYLAALALCGATACVSYESTHTSTAPTESSVAALVGTWRSAVASGVPSPSICTDFAWTPTQQTPTSASGSFTAMCAGALKVAGTASATLNGTTVNWTANANASTPGLPSCNVSLTGTAEL